MTREEAIAILDGFKHNPLFNEQHFEALDMAISALSENKGKWIMPIQDDGMSDPIYYQVRCSKCGFDLDPQTWHQELHQYGADKYCPNCGADMRGET